MRCSFYIVAFALTGCQTGPELSVYGVEPGSGWREASTTVAIDGAHFYPTVNIAAGETDGVESASGLTVRLTSEQFGDVTLGQVRIEGSSEIQAVVPSGLNTGTYGLEVFDTRGRQAQLENAFEVTFSEVERFELSASPSTVDAGEEFSVNVRPIASGTTEAVTYQGAVAVRIHVEPILLDDTATHDFLEFDIEVPNSSWVQTGFGDARPEFEGVLVGNEQFRIASNTEINGRFVVKELLSTEESDFGALGELALKWGQRDDLLLALDIREAGSLEILDAADGPEELAAGTHIEVSPRLVYAGGDAVPSGGQGLMYLVQDRGGFLEPFVVVSGVEIPPVLRQLRDATIPPSTSDVQHVQLVAWELSENLSLEDVACPPPVDAAYSCSIPMQVYSGSASDHRVETDVSLVRAGDEIAMTVTPVDFFGNDTVWSGPVSGWSFSQQGTDIRALEGVMCPQPGVDSFFVTCTGIPTMAEVTPIGFVDNLTGWSSSTAPVEVLSGAPQSLSVDARVVKGVPLIEVEAGQTLEVEIEVMDAYGNLVQGDDLEAIAVDIAWSGAKEMPSCVRDLSPTSAPTSLFYLCTMTVAAEKHNIVAQYGDLSGSSSLFEVLPGGLDSVVIDLLTDTSDFVAGDEMEVLMTAYDAYGNHLVDPVPNGIDASSDPSSQTQSGLITDGNGTTSTAFTLTTAGPTSIVATYFGDEVGRSDVFDVLADVPESLEIVTDYPWAWVSESYTIQVNALDAYGNVADLDEDVTITSANSEFTAITGSLSDGTLTTGVIWATTLFEERIEANSDSGFEASAPNISVVKRCGHSLSPTFTQSWNGLVENGVRRACHDLSGEFSVRLDATGSAPATGAVLQEFVLAERKHTAVRASGSTSAPILNRVVSGKGLHSIGGLLAQANGCAVEAFEDVWTGFGVGVPVGPLSVEPSTNTIESGKTGSTGSTDIEIGPAYDCASDPATDARVYLRSDRGVLSSTGFSIASDGGRYVLLDTDGEATVQLEAVLTTMGGVASVHAWNGTGDARGVGRVEVTGDDRLPIVFWQDPVGTTEQLIDSVTISFSEPMRVDRLEEAGNYELCSLSGGALIDIDAVTVNDAATEAEVFFGSSVDLGADTWSLTLFGGLSGSSATWTSPCGQLLSSFSVWGITDVGGLRLKDAVSSAAVNDYTLEFGDVVDDSPDVICAATSDSYSFQPDGDGNTTPGLTDSIRLNATVATGFSNPAVWRSTVFDADGEILRREFAAGGSSAWAFVWDGRDQSERIVAPGTYEIQIHGLDQYGNEGANCRQTVSVVNHVGVYDE